MEVRHGSIFRRPSRTPGPHSVSLPEASRPRARRQWLHGDRRPRLCPQRHGSSQQDSLRNRTVVCRVVHLPLCYSDFSIPTPEKMTTAPPSSWKIILAFGLVYVFWGSTYLGIGIAVEQIPPAFMCASRFLVAGIVMLAYCAATGRQIRFSARQLAHFAVVGILLLMGGNLTLSYAERIVPTGLSALLVAVSPLWFLVLDSLLLGDHHISGRGKIGLVIGILGVVVLIWPDLMHPTALGRREFWWSIALQGGSFTWALGSVPPGRYILHVWNENALPATLRALSHEVMVSQDSHALGLIHVRVTMAASAPHKNKIGRDYQPPSPNNPIYVQP